MKSEAHNATIYLITCIDQKHACYVVKFDQDPNNLDDLSNFRTGLKNIFEEMVPIEPEKLSKDLWIPNFEFTCLKSGLEEEILTKQDCNVCFF